MEKHPAKAALGKLPVKREIAVFVITGNWHSLLGQMNADLVGAPRVELRHDQRELAQALKGETREAGDSCLGLAAIVVNDHPAIAVRCRKPSQRMANELVRNGQRPATMAR